MGALFLASGASTGMAAISLLLFLSGESGGAEVSEGQARRPLRAWCSSWCCSPPSWGCWAGRPRPSASGHSRRSSGAALVVAGLVLPLLLDLVGAGSRSWAVLAAVLVLVGGFILRYVIVMARA